MRSLITLQQRSENGYTDFRGQVWKRVWEYPLRGKPTSDRYAVSPLNSPRDLKSLASFFKLFQSIPRLHRKSWIVLDFGSTKS